MALDYSPSPKDDDLLRQMLANDFQTFKLCGLEADDPEAMLQDRLECPMSAWTDVAANALSAIGRYIERMKAIAKMRSCYSLRSDDQSRN